MESALYDFYLLAEAYQKTNEWAQQTSEFSDTSQLVNKKPYARTFHGVISIYFFPGNSSPTINHPGFSRICILVAWMIKAKTVLFVFNPFAPIVISVKFLFAISTPYQSEKTWE